MLASLATLLSPPTSAQGETAADERKARIRELVAIEKGDITALEPTTTGDGRVLIGYSSGTLLNCAPDQRCTEYAGTPNIAVERIAISRRGGAEILWVTYAQGALYLCESAQCRRFTRTDPAGASPTPRP